jgi:prolyl oligopeptidase
MPVSTSSPAAVEEMIHGVTVRDPYRWLEDRTMAATEEWIREQQKRCDDYFRSCDDLGQIRLRVREYLDVEVTDQPAKVAGRSFYRRRNKGQEQGSIYVREGKNESLLIDPSKYGPFVSVGIHRISQNGSLLAYEQKSGGEDKKAIHIVDVATGRVLPDRLESGYARGFAFTGEDGGFCYCHESSQGEEHTIRLHHFHESVADQVVFRAARSRGSRLVLTADDARLGAIWIHRLKDDFVADFWIAKEGEYDHWLQVFQDRKIPYTPILKQDRIFVLSHDDAPNGRLVELDPDGRELCTVVPEQSGVIDQLVMAVDRVYLHTLEMGTPAVYAWGLNGTPLGRVAAPSDGTIQMIPNQNPTEAGLFYSFESFSVPPMIFHYDAETNEHTCWYQQPRPKTDGRPVVRQTFFLAKDGTEIPLTLVVPDDLKTKRQTAAVMTSYGGFGVSVTPRFSVLVAILLQCGATFALPHIRGGGEFGRAWHYAGRARNRQTAFDDFLAAAESIRANEDVQRLAIFGGSNSGLLVAVALTQGPAFFCAVLCVAPLLDMVRYEQFDRAIQWQQEYGSAENREDFEVLYSYSPYHHVGDDVDYPATMFVAGDKDDRCSPAHARKMVARMSERVVQKSPVLLDYSEERGHSPVLPLSVRVEALTRRIAFLLKELNLPFSAGGGA